MIMHCGRKNEADGKFRMHLHQSVIAPSTIISVEAVISVRRDPTSKTTKVQHSNIGTLNYHSPPFVVDGVETGVD